MSSVTTQSTHPLTAVVLSGENRDPVGHLVTDPIGDREFRFVVMRGESTASAGHAAVASSLSAVADDFNNVTVFASANLTAASRDFVGIVVAGSTVASGMMCYVMTKGKLGKVTGSLFPDTVIALVSTTAAAGQLLEARAGAGVSEFKLIAATTQSADAVVSGYTHVVGMALSTDTGGKLVRGVIRSSLLHGGGGFGGIL